MAKFLDILRHCCFSYTFYFNHCWKNNKCKKQIFFKSICMGLELFFHKNSQQKFEYYSSILITKPPLVRNLLFLNFLSRNILESLYIQKHIGYVRLLQQIIGDRWSLWTVSARLLDRARVRITGNDGITVLMVCGRRVLNSKISQLLCC